MCAVISFLSIDFLRSAILFCITFHGFQDFAPQCASVRSQVRDEPLNYKVCWSQLTRNMRPALYLCANESCGCRPLAPLRHGQRTFSFESRTQEKKSQVCAVASRCPFVRRSPLPVSATATFRLDSTRPLRRRSLQPSLLIAHCRVFRQDRAADYSGHSQGPGPFRASAKAKRAFNCDSSPDTV